MSQLQTKTAGLFELEDRFPLIITVCLETHKARCDNELQLGSTVRMISEIFLPTIFLPALGVAEDGARIWWARIFSRSNFSLASCFVPPCDNSGSLFSDGH